MKKRDPNKIKYRYACRKNLVNPRSPEIHRFIDGEKRAVWTCGEMLMRYSVQWSDVAPRIRAAKAHHGKDRWIPIAAGHWVLNPPPEVREDKRLANLGDAPPAFTPAFPVLDFPGLSPRQCLCLALWAEFDDVGGVAALMRCSTSTAYVTLHVIRKKLGFADTKQAIGHYFITRRKSQARTGESDA